MSDDLFRKAALDKLASPERLDVLMKVTSPQGWAALSMVAAVLVGAIVWSIFGSFPERIDGQGLLTGGGGVRQILANGDGTLSSLDLAMDQDVKADQVVGEVTGTGVVDTVREADRKYEDARRNAESDDLVDQDAQRGKRQNIDRDRIDLDRLNQELTAKKATLAQKKDSLRQGLITSSSVDAAQAQVDVLIGEIKATNTDIQNETQSIGNLDQRIRARKASVEALRQDSERTKGTAQDISEVKSTVEGRVVEVSKRKGDRVHSGDLIATIQPPASQFEAIIYVNSSFGKKIERSMEAQISPSGIRREEFGFMKGSVSTVGDYVATTASAMNTLGNETLAREFLKDGSYFEVRIAPEPDAHTPSGYAWSSSKGPLVKITPGTKVNVSVIVERHAPIVEVLPFLKRMFGAS